MLIIISNANRLYDNEINESEKRKQNIRYTLERCKLFNINSFSRLSAPKSEDARGSEKLNRVRIGLGMTWISKVREYDDLNTIVKQTEQRCWVILPVGMNQEIWKQHKTVCMHSIQRSNSFPLPSLLSQNCRSYLFIFKPYNKNNSITNH